MYTQNCDHNYLVHSGVLGQRWGIRRYRNPDGSLTEAGKKKAAKYAKKYSQLTGFDIHGDASKSKNHKDSKSTISPKNLSEMSTAELNKATDRYNAETRYLGAQKSNTSAKASYVKKSKAATVAYAIVKASEKPVTDAYQDFLGKALKNYGNHMLKELGSKNKN